MASISMIKNKKIFLGLSQRSVWSGSVSCDVLLLHRAMEFPTRGTKDPTPTTKHLDVLRAILLNPSVWRQLPWNFTAKPRAACQARLRGTKKTGAAAPGAEDEDLSMRWNHMVRRKLLEHSCVFWSYSAGQWRFRTLSGMAAALSEPKAHSMSLFKSYTARQEHLQLFRMAAGLLSAIGI